MLRSFNGRAVSLCHDLSQPGLVMHLSEVSGSVPVPGPRPRRPGLGRDNRAVTFSAKPPGSESVAQPASGVSPGRARRRCGAVRPAVEIRGLAECDVMVTSPERLVSHSPAPASRRVTNLTGRAAATAGAAARARRMIMGRRLFDLPPGGGTRNSRQLAWPAKARALPRPYGRTWALRLARDRAPRRRNLGLTRLQSECPGRCRIRSRTAGV